MVFIKRSPNLGEPGHPGSKPFSFAKHRKKPATPRTRISAQTSHSILICPPGAQGSYVNRSLSLQLQALSLECTLAGPMSLLPRGSFLPLPGPGGYCQITASGCARGSVCGARCPRLLVPLGSANIHSPRLYSALRVREWSGPRPLCYATQACHW